MNCASLDVVKLEYLLEVIGEEGCRALLADFSCPNAPDVESFIQDHVYLYHKMDRARTFLLFCPYQGENVVVGFFSLGGKPLYIRKGVSSNMRKLITGFKDNTLLSVSASLIGQLARNSKYPKELLPGETLLKLAFREIKASNQIVASRVILVECEDKKNLIEFYEKKGNFKNIGKDPDDKLVQLIRRSNTLDD